MLIREYFHTFFYLINFLTLELALVHLVIITWKIRYAEDMTYLTKLKTELPRLFIRRTMYSNLKRFEALLL